MARRRNGWKLPMVLVGAAAALVFLAACTDGEGDTTSPTPTVSSDGAATTAPTTGQTTGSSATPATQNGAGSVQVWFSTGDGCDEVSPFSREVPSGADRLRVAFEALVAGPTADEGAAGAGSLFSAETSGTIEAVTSRGDGLLIVDLSDLRPLIPDASTSCGSMALLAQLDATAFQFDEVDRVRYRIRGSCDEFGNFVQTECFDRDPSGAMLAVPTVERASGSGCSPPSDDGLADGRWYGLVETAGDGDLVFDLACWFSSTAAVAAAAEDGDESPPPNDYHVRNENDLLRTLTVSSTAEVTWYPDAGSPADPKTVGYGQWRVDREGRRFQLAVWLTIDSGAVSIIEEQWVP